MYVFNTESIGREYTPISLVTGVSSSVNTRFQVSITNRVTVFVYGTAVKFNT